MEFDVLTATEQACVALAYSASVSASLNATIYSGLNNMIVDPPAIICYAEGSKEHVPQSGIHNVSAHIMVLEMAKPDNTEMTYSILGNAKNTSSIAGPLFEAFLNSNTRTILNSYPNYYVYELFVDSPHSTWTGDAWQRDLHLDIVCGLTGTNN